jgi:hypothetical protein
MLWQNYPLFFAALRRPLYQVQHKRSLKRNKRPLCLCVPPLRQYSPRPSPRNRVRSILAGANSLTPHSKLLSGAARFRVMRQKRLIPAVDHNRQITGTVNQILGRHVCPAKAFFGAQSGLCQKLLDRHCIGCKANAGRQSPRGVFA